MHRKDVINILIDRYKLDNYLEIGVNDGRTMESIKAKHKLGVDPDCHTYQVICEGKGDMFCGTSDEFFEQLDINVKYDIIFIDGLHVAEQVFRDITNSIKHLSDNGIIVLHDCSPPNKNTIGPVNNYGIWNGNVYIGYIEAVKTYNLEYYTVSTDYGCGVIFPRNVDLNQERKYINHDWDYFEKNRKDLLNLIEVGEFLNKIRD